MATVSTFFSDVRHDLRDYSGIEYGNDLLITYLNRCIYLTNHEMAKMDSHWSLESDDVTLSSGNSYADVPTGCITVRQIWYDNEMLIKRTPHWIFSYRESIGNTSTGTPRYWAQHKATAIFDYVADDDYTLRFIYNKGAADITAVTEDMPYSSQYDDYMRQSVVLLARASRDGSVNPVDNEIKSLFRNVFVREAITPLARKPKYHLDF